MTCNGLLEINRTIFTEYFKNDNNLCNLYNWMEKDDVNKNCILNIDTDVLCNFQPVTFFNGDPTSSFYNCNLNDNIKSFSNIVKNVDNSYNIVEFSYTNAKHFIPNIPNSLITNIDNTHKNNIIQIFNIYQFYDHLINKKEDILKNSITSSILYNFFNPSTPSSPNDSNTICPISNQSHYNNIIVNNRNKDQLTPATIYVCRGIYLTLLYKYISQIYLSYYTTCNSLTTTNCPNNSINTINDLMNKLKSSIEKVSLFTNYTLNVTYNAGKLNIEDTGTSATSFFYFLDKDIHIIYNKNKNIYIEIPNNGIDITNNTYNISDFTELRGKFNDNDKCVILSKKNDHSAYSYNNTINGLTIKNKIFDENKSNYQKSISNYDVVNGSFNNIDYLYYLTFIIIIFVLIAIIATNSEQSRKTRVFIILVIVVLMYIMIFSYLEVTKRLAEGFSIVDRNREINIINSKFEKCLRLIYMQSSNYGMIRLYDKLNVEAKQQLNNVSKQNNTLSSAINRNDSNTNSEWHRLFQRTLFIHTVFLFLIVILTYLWLSTIIPGMNIYLLFITIIACMVLIFYYFRNLHRVVRSEYKHRYWTKMNVSK
jgi:hypothetical protein